MAFLSGVLEGVKEDDAVKNYEKYINVDNRFDAVVQSLKNAIGKGSTELPPQLDKVSGCLSEYRSQVETLTDNVTRRLGELKDNKINQYINAVVGQGGEKLKKQLEDWRHMVPCIFNDVNTIENDHINLLDTTLRDKLQHEIRPIKSAVRMLGDSAAVNNFIEQVMEVDKVLEMQQERLINTIHDESLAVQVRLRSKFKNIWKGIRSLGETERTQVASILETLALAKLDAQNLLVEFDMEYERKIRERFDDINSKLTDITRIETSDSSLKEKYVALTKAVGAIEKVYTDKLKDVKNKVDTAVDHAFQNDEHGFDKLDDNVKNGLVAVRLQIVQQLEQFGEQVWNAVQKSMMATGTSYGRHRFTTLKLQLRDTLGADFTEQLNQADTHNTGFASAIDSVLLYMKNANDANSRSPRGGDLLKKLQTAIYTAVDARIKQVIKQDHEIKFDENTLMTKYYGQTRKDRGTLRGLIIRIKEQFGTGIEGTGEAVSVDPMKFEDSFKYKTTDGQGAKDTYDIRNEEVTRMVDELENLPELVKTQKQAAETRMNYLKKEIQKITKEIDDAETVIRSAKVALDDVTDALRNIAVSAEEDVKNAVSHLKIALHNTTEGVFETVTTHVRHLFSEQRIADLRALQSLLQTQLKRVKHIVDKDLETGLKGFLKALNGENNKHIMLLKADKGVASLAVNMNLYLRKISAYIDGQLTAHPKVKSQLEALNRPSQNLFLGLSEFKHLNHPVSLRLYTLSSATSALDPQALPDAGRPVLRALQRGMMGFVGELGKGYVSRYSMQTFEGDLTEYAGELVTPYSGPDKVYKLTAAGRRVAKIFLTLFNTVYEDISRLNDKCESDWREKSLCKIHENADNPLGLFLQRCGYEVASDENSKEGELRFPSTGHTGAMILAKLLKPITGTRDNKHLQQRNDKTDEQDEEETQPVAQPTDFKLSNILDCILRHSDKYNEVCHLSTLTSKRQPCSVYEMLVWLSGLPHSPVHASELGVSILEFFEDPSEHKEETDGPTLMTEVNPETLVRYAHPRNITWYGITEAIEHLCSKSYDVITAIAGTGDAETIYGSDLCNNAMKFHYPQTGEDCLQMIIDVLRRVFPPLRFLQAQCTVGASHNGWLRCTYGRDVQPATWPCKEHPEDRSKCQPTCPPKCQANCQPKSPLMSYLNDCHVGCLPHKVTSIGCKSVCLTCPGNKPGMPCLTPLGFRGFSGSMKTGRDLCNVLAKFFGNPNLSALICLAPTPPSTLPEHFTFTLSLVTGWNNSYLNEQMTLKKKVASSIATESMDLYNSTSELTDAIDNAYGNCTSTDSGCTDAHLISLTSSGTCNNKTLNCAPYLQSLFADSYNYLAYNNSKTYLSWALYLPWNFHKYLEALLTAFKDIFCSDWGCRSCLNGKCKRGEHGAEDKICRCSSFVKCNGVMPTLYKYGFTFHDAPTLDARKFPMTCFDFQTLLFKVTQSKYFTVLFNKCDDFLFKIRAPFIWLNVALWLLSLLYLTHIMVIRLDLLHIKSHLHSPSSHRIAAQSLLAAERVNKLAKVFYLQP